MAIQHKSIPDSERHEPKGGSTATIDQVYASNGAGSGSWREIPFVLSGVMDDVSNPSFILIPVPFNIKVQSFRFTLFNAITLANSVLTVTRSDGAAMGSVVIPFTASAEGTTIDLVPTGNDVITASGQKYIKIATDGASTTTAKLAVAIKCKVV